MVKMTTGNRKRKKKVSDGWPATHVEMRDVATLVPYANNARTHSEKQVKQVAASIREWGWTTPCLIDEEGVLIAGHCRVLAAKLLGIEEVPVMIARGWSEAQKKAYVLADNKLAENAGWDTGLLKIELEGLAELDFDLELIGFDLNEVSQITGDLSSHDDVAPEKPMRPVTEANDTWLLGQHRVRCGDSTSAKDVEILLAGATPDIMITDPPYGVDYKPEWRGEFLNPGKRDVGKVKNDDKADWTEAWELFTGSVAYIWHSALHGSDALRTLEDTGFIVRSQIIWNKSRMALSRGHYHWKHESCWYVVRQGAKANWSGDRKQSTIWDIPTTDDGERTKHSTQKPLECMGRPMRNHDLYEVYDPFCGSGSTLIACELVGRRCYAMEIDPGYVDVIIERWQKRTGKDATLESTGESFDSVHVDRLEEVEK